MFSYEVYEHFLCVGEVGETSAYDQESENIWCLGFIHTVFAFGLI